jgi:pimeloyl-ACP methyl ester carboxylesterase
MPSNSRQPRKSAPAPTSRALQPELVDPLFLLKGFGLMVIAGIIFAYVTLCVLYSRTQWQIVLHPSRQVASTPAALGLPFEEVHFGVDSSGEPQLDGWWLPNGLPGGRTVLILHGERGMMSVSLPVAGLLHNLGLNVMVFDYRGYGRSGGQHPSQALMRHDAASALDYLLHTRGVHPSDLVVYGHDLGASLALEVIKSSGLEVPAVILDAPDGDMLDRAHSAARSAIIPVTMLFHEDFPLAAPLKNAPAPLLIISYGNNPPSAKLKNASDPKMLLEVNAADKASLSSGIQRFLAEHAPAD